MDQELLQKYHKIASMAAMGVPEGQIAEAVALTAGRITQIKSDPAFQELLAGKYAAKMEQASEFNDSWDAVEKKSLVILSESLKYNRNPEFALKVAMVANKAQRRGTGNTALPTNMGEKVVINLNASFVNKLQIMQAPKQANEVHPVLINQDITQPHKKVNLMAPGQVDKLLNGAGNVLNADMQEVELEDIELVL